MQSVRAAQAELCPVRALIPTRKAACCYLPCALSPLPALLCYEDFFQHFLIVDMLVLLMFPLLCRRPAYSLPLRHSGCGEGR